jgi:hypothetical protein
VPSGNAAASRRQMFTVEAASPEQRVAVSLAVVQRALDVLTGRDALLVGIWVINRRGGFSVLAEFRPAHPLPAVEAALRAVLAEIMPGAVLERTSSEEAAPRGGPAQSYPAPESAENSLERSRGPSRSALYAGLPEVVADVPAAERPARYVNAFLAERDTDRPVPARPARPAADYNVLANIGEFDRRSLLEPQDGRFPDELLPEGSWLRIVLDSGAPAGPAIQGLFLPPAGASFSCDCGYGGPHDASCARRPWARFAVTMPDEPGTWGADLVIYYQAAIVHAQRLTAPVGGTGPDGPRSALLSRMTTSFADLGKLGGRTASILISSAADAILVNGLTFAPNHVSVKTSQADPAVRTQRALLGLCHFDTTTARNGSVSIVDRFDGGVAKPQDGLIADLTKLARHGAELYGVLFAENEIFQTLAALIRAEAADRQRPAVLQVVGDAAADLSLLWGLVYDLPIEPDPELCPSLSEFGPAGRGPAELPLLCPYAKDHEEQDSVLCPFGFWGLSSIIEQPRDNPADVVSDTAHPVSLLVAADSSLDQGYWQQHLAALTRAMPDAVTMPVIEDAATLGSRLGPEDMDVVYLYCHSGTEAAADGVLSSIYLNLGTSRLRTSSIHNWARRPWPYPHWPRRRPLVVLNGCHTVEQTSQTLGGFVDAFAGRAGAAGVLGTEVKLTQAVAGFAMEHFLAALTAGQTVGAALRSMRWAMLAQGNVMGLAYTPYCLSQLTLRRASRMEGAR